MLRVLAVGLFVVCVAAAPQAAAQERPPVLPFAYVGKLIADNERYAVLAREGNLLLVRAGDVLARQYRVQSFTDQQLLLTNLQSGVTQALAFGAQDLPQRAASAAPAAESARPGYEH
jgi:hypothetical protein